MLIPEALSYILTLMRKLNDDEYETDDKLNRVFFSSAFKVRICVT